MTKMRNSNIELLRIIAIILVVFSHFCYHGAGHILPNMEFGINRFILEAFTLGNIGIVLFMLITGYFLIDSNKLNIEKILKLILQVLFYSVLIYIMLVLLNFESFSIKNMIHSLLPITYKGYWFFTAYIILYLFHPYINKFLNGLKRKEYLNYIILMFAIFSVLATITRSNYYGSELILFLMFYSIGGYLNKYKDNKFKNCNNKVMLISIITIILSIIFIDLLREYKIINLTNSIYLLEKNSPFLIMFSIALFDKFTRKKTCENNLINKISSLVFGVYLIHDNQFLRYIIWGDIFKVEYYSKSPYLVLYMISVIIVIILSCFIIEYLRKTIFEKPLFKLLDKKLDKIQGKIEQILN